MAGAVLKSVIGFSAPVFPASFSTPAANVTVKAESDTTTIPTAGTYMFTGHAVTDSSGAFKLYLPDGSYTLALTP